MNILTHAIAMTLGVTLGTWLVKRFKFKEKIREYLAQKNGRSECCFIH